MSHRTRLALLLATLASPSAALAQLPPDKAVASLHPVNDLQVELFASEPRLINPTSIDVDHLGRVWVAEAVNYRRVNFGRPIIRPAGDRIVILTDKDGDGKADEATVFYQGKDLYGPMGIAVAKDATGPGWKVFVGQSPDILVFEDKDGDGHADGPPKKLFAGCFNGFDHDHGVHGLTIGPDDKLYFSVGDRGVHGLKDKYGKVWTTNHTDCQAGTIWRCDLDGTNLELIAHNFRNEYKPCVDSFGTVFVSDNDDDGNQQTRICYVMPGGNYGYWPRGPGQTHWHEEQPGVVPKILRTYFGSPTGMCVYEGTLLPKRFWGQLLHTDAGPRHVRCYHLKPDGAGYQVDREDIVTSTDTWFRPSDIVVAPDGSVIVSDWYDPGVGGHGMGDWTRGRIYRITPKGHKGYKVPKVDLSNSAGIIDALASPNLALRHMAMDRIFHLRDGRESEKLLTGILEKAIELHGPFDNPYLRARFVWQLARLWGAHKNAETGMGTLGELERLTIAQDERLRTQLIRLVKKLIGREELPYLGEKPDSYKVLTYESDKASPAVRREMLLAMRDMDPTKAKPYVLELAKKYDGKDVFYLRAIGIAVGKDPKRREIILADFEKQFPTWDDRTAGLVFELRPPSVMAKLGDYLRDPKLTAAQKGQILNILATSDDPSAGRTLLRYISGSVPVEMRSQALKNLRTFLPGKWSALKKSPELKAAVEKLLTNSTTRTVAIDLMAAAATDEFLPTLVGVAENGQLPLADRKAAVHGLGSFQSPSAIAALAKLVGVAALRTDAIQALGQVRTTASIAPLKQVVADAKQPADVRLEAVSALAASQPGTKWLIDEQKRGRLPKELVADAGRLLRNSPYQGLRNQAMIVFPAPGKMDLKKLPAIAELARRRGNAQRGRQLLAASARNDLQCLKCHMVRGQGGQVGPDLSMIGKKGSRENLFESILLPSKAIADQYASWQIVTSSGLAITGLLIEETADSVTLRDANGKDTKIPKKEIESRTKSRVSLMPDNLAAQLTPDELVDLVEYLFTLRTPALTPDQWSILGPFDNGEGDSGLDRDFGPEKRIDLSASYPGKGGPVKWRTVRPTSTGYVDLAAFHGPLSSNSVSYLMRTVVSPVDQEATILIGTDDGCRLRVNGQLVLSHNRHEAAAPERDRVKVKLKKGANVILVKINNGNDPHGLYFTIVAEQELK